MLTVRAAEWPRDVEALSRLDTSFTTDIIYRPIRDELSFRLEATTVHPPVTKRYLLEPADPHERDLWDFASIAEEGADLAGFAAARYVAWNRRVVVEHLYVAPTNRRQGVGTRLLHAGDAYAQSVEARCLWLETQNVNFPAIQFYRRAGFEFCGFDESLYDPNTLSHEEIALFFARSVSI